MVFKGTSSLIIRLSRVFISRPFKSIYSNQTHELPKVIQHKQNLSKHPTRFYLFPSIYRTYVNQLNGQIRSNLLPFRIALDGIKRRLFYAAPTSSHLVLSLLGYSLVQQSTIDRYHLDKTFYHIGKLLSNVHLDEQNHNEMNQQTSSLDDYELGRLLGCGSNAAVYEARLRSSIDSIDSDITIFSRQSSDEDLKTSQLNILPDGHFNLAIKMLYNYGIQSNAEALEKSMRKELLPLRQSFIHPNLVRMYSCFVDDFPLLNEAHEHYPMAIPTRLSPDGYGRNKTLFIVMRRYDLTLNKYIESNKPNLHERLLLFTQLLEALLYLNQRSIAHRDLKSDNILICNGTGELVLADFGCALTHPPDLRVRYTTDEISKGGNLALMAPEIVTCQPDLNSFLDYSKADLWASGTLFYEFFSEPNPFFHGSYKQETYDDTNLPTISSIASSIIERLVYSMLRKTPEQRPSTSLATNCFHLHLWFKSIKSINELYEKYMWTALETVFNKHNLPRVEFNLKKLFFERQNSQSLYQAQTFLNDI